jgi:predicted short-subunit dehydrogenase-like oxidoreductase (DUF2520 family)
MDASRREAMTATALGAAIRQQRLDHEVTETVDTTTGRPRPTFAFVGAGRAGSALATAFARAGYAVSAIHSRTPAHAQRLAAACDAVVAPSAAAAALLADITLLTVPDAEIERVTAAIAASGAVLSGRSLVHCSATTGPAKMSAAGPTGAQLGVFHPLQALAGARSAPLLRGTTFALEAPPVLHAQLAALVADLGGHCLDLPAGARALYHAAAVLVGNTPLALLARATSLLEEAGVDGATAHRALAALLAGAVHNAVSDGPAAALTGPVVRGDAATVARHLDVLAADPTTRELYRRLSLETLGLAGPEGREAVADVLAEAPARRARSARVVAHPRVA